LPITLMPDRRWHCPDIDARRTRTRTSGIINAAAK